MGFQKILLDYNTNVQETSIQAFKEFGEEKRITREQEYMDKLWEIGEPSTDNEVTRFAGFKDPNRYRPRRNKLVEKGLIASCNERPDNHTKINATPFWFTDKGLELVGGKQ